MCDETGAVIPDCVGGTNTCYKSTDTPDSERIQWQSMGLNVINAPFNTNIVDYIYPGNTSSGVGGSIVSTGATDRFIAGWADFFNIKLPSTGEIGGIQVNSDSAQCLSGSISSDGWTGGSVIHIESDVPMIVAIRVGTENPVTTITGNGTTHITIAPQFGTEQYIYSSTIATTNVTLSLEHGTGQGNVGQNVEGDLNLSYWHNADCDYEYKAACSSTGVHTDIHTGATGAGNVSYYVAIPCGDVPATP